MPERQWETPEWFKDQERRHLWIYQNITEFGATMSALVQVVNTMREDVDDCKEKDSDTSTKLDIVIQLLKPFTDAHDQQIQRQILTAVTPQGTTIQQTTTTTISQNPLEWAVKNPLKAIIISGVSIPAIVTFWKALVWLVQLLATYGKS